MPIAQACDELGLNAKTVNDWALKRRRELSGEPDPRAEDRELREAKKRICELKMENAFLKKPRPSSPKRSTLAKCGLVLPEKGSFALTMMAGVLGVRRSGYWSWASNGCPEDDWSEVHDAVRRVWLDPTGASRPAS